MYTYDTLGSEALARVQEHKAANGKATTGPAAREDLFTVVKELALSGEDEVINKLWQEVNTVPDWVDWNQIKRAQDVNTHILFFKNLLTYVRSSTDMEKLFS